MKHARTWKRVKRALIALTLGAVTTVVVAWSRWVVPPRAPGRSPLIFADPETTRKEIAILRSEWFGCHAYGGISLGPRHTRLPAASIPNWVRDNLPPLKPPTTIIPGMFAGEVDKYVREEHTWAYGWPMVCLAWKEPPLAIALLGRLAPTPAQAEWIVPGTFRSHSATRYAVALPIRPLPFAFIINTLFFAAYWYTSVFALRMVRRNRRTQRGLCPNCAHQIIEANRGVCPECGNSTQRA